LDQPRASQAGCAAFAACRASSTCLSEPHATVTNVLPVAGFFTSSTRTAEDLALVYDALQGPDPEDPTCAGRGVEPALPELPRGLDGLRIAVAGGYFQSQGAPEAIEAVESVASALGISRRVELPNPSLARAAAMIVTSVEGAELHLPDLIARAADFDPMTRARFLAGALTPGAWYSPGIA
jgi:1-carboxybiuret hydrolase